ncbi:hypothetical protein [Pseudomonas sp. 5P_3.1_Bac2]|uniref:COG3904 family protein n=1 Tax=Pseudomonas sp. 5P_3.1_Bac2 TaxID=2971617 RepID=UPI0021C89321|nr:hypothetical protein [Pseudomonas sp. 5P_3.1_Bac2]MCU1716858.1 hypothetical protein [Pseudomonas sp. 5P_3.1_Bac2]
MARRFWQLLTLCAALGCISPAMAKVEVEAGTHQKLGKILLAKVSETIAPGDYESLLVGIRNHPGNYAKKIVMLDSIGGSVSEAIKLGRLLRETGFDSLVPSTGICQGSCVYLLAAGKSKIVRGYVGVHRPYYPGSDSVHYASRLSSNPSPATYFKQMNVAPGLLELINSTDPARMRVLTPAELARYRLN